MKGMQVCMWPMLKSMSTNAGGHIVTGFAMSTVCSHQETLLAPGQCEIGDGVHVNLGKDPGI
jgi:hypothetical protein